MIIPLTRRVVGRSRWSRSFFGVLLCAAIWFTGACGNGAGLVPVKDGNVTSVFRHSAVDLLSESGRVGATKQDLLIGGPDAGPVYEFYRPRGVAVDTVGDIYVLDGGNDRVQVFDADGRFIRSIGGEGQGPGEFTRAWGLALAGPQDRLTVHDQGSRRMSTWTRDGDFLDSAPIDGSLMSTLGGLEDGSLVGLYSRFDYELFNRKRGFYRVALQRFDREGNELNRYMEGELQLEPVPLGMPRLATDGKDLLYFAAANEFAITAMDVENATTVWRFELADEHGALVSGEGATQPIRRLQVDGHGHLYVWGAYGSRDFEGPYPVVVLSANGDVLASGTFGLKGFHAAHGDHVYQLDEDESREEIVLRRFRLVEDFHK